MSYDAIILLPAVIVGTLASLVALGVGARMRLGLAIVGLVVSCWVLWSGLTAGDVEARLPRTGWDLEVARGHAVWLKSASAGAYLPWALAPLLPALAALGFWARGRRARRMAGLALSCLPVVLTLWLGARFAGPYLAGTWGLDDVRWAWGYYVACPEPGRCSTHDVDVACDTVEQLATARYDELVRHVPPDEVAKAVASCRGRNR